MATIPSCPEARLVIAARYVVCCAGALHTPALLLKSKVSSAAIGRNLHLHPATAVAAIFDKAADGTHVDLIKGRMMTCFSKEVAGWDGTDGYGALLAVPQVVRRTPSCQP